MDHTDLLYTSAGGVATISGTVLGEDGSSPTEVDVTATPVGDLSRRS